ncbi:hypothetical protein GGF32_001013 [Allomyces javanicus]|nr:hypothetical protein GGF32_001013 [Allomyces javanicus]
MDRQSATAPSPTPASDPNPLLDFPRERPQPPATPSIFSFASSNHNGSSRAAGCLAPLAALLATCCGGGTMLGRSRTHGGSSVLSRSSSMSISMHAPGMQLRDLTDWEIEAILVMNESVVRGADRLVTHADDAEDATIGAAAPPGLVDRVDVNYIPSNKPIEDCHVIAYQDGLWIMGVFDGHGGPECARVVRDYLPSYVLQEVRRREAELPAPLPCDHPDRVALIKAALLAAFHRLDDELMRLPFLVFPNLKSGSFRPNRSARRVEAALRPAIAGCVGSMVVADGTSLYVAHVGDSRVLLLRTPPDDPADLVGLQLSTDHTCKNPSEMRNLYLAHPGEERTVCRAHPYAGGVRLLGGLMPTRAFGDAMYKWPASWHKGVFGLLKVYPDSTPSHYYSPPYLHATPEITTHRLDDHDRMVLVASDGLFDELRNEDIVELLHRYRTATRNGTLVARRTTAGGPMDDPLGLHTTTSPSPTAFNYVNTITSAAAVGLPTPNTPEKVTDHAAAANSDDGESAITGMTARWTTRDVNAATHLLRNSVGGANRARVRQIMSLPWPESRDYRDDVTCLVMHVHVPVPGADALVETATAAEPATAAAGEPASVDDDGLDDHDPPTKHTSAVPAAVAKTAPESSASPNSLHPLLNLASPLMPRASFVSDAAPAAAPANASRPRTAPPAAESVFSVATGSNMSMPPLVVPYMMRDENGRPISISTTMSAAPAADSEAAPAPTLALGKSKLGIEADRASSVTSMSMSTGSGTTPGAGRGPRPAPTTWPGVAGIKDDLSFYEDWARHINE